MLLFKWRRFGRVKTYYGNGRLKSEEDYLKGKRNGKIKKYY